MTYLPLALVGVLAAAVVFACAVPRWRARGVLGEVSLAVAIAAIVLCLLTAAFDTVMIAAGLFRYGEGTLLGIEIGRAPIEDLSYPLAAVLAMPAVWELTRRAER